ncbi:response regulator transcription factor [Thioclava sp. DLFJ4-1]|uniref:response regulator transcription factor n=1 Tax=Thioclava sp. DLFJ4-1 TaxID=1915313 RepID=UPI000998E523|nr:response regulator transcription factor [Thioclava sp. DLFJ4-1]OOY16366.1 hypothetical protein BMI85_12800 [Thioclava sp. DLFJ4-1]
MEQQTILVVEDDPSVRGALRDCFEAEGWSVREASDATGMMQEIEAGDVDLVTLDLGLGADDGLALARVLRGRSNIPVIFITGQGQPLDRVRGLEAGADDYIVKPFAAREVAIRIRRVLDGYRTRNLPRERLRIDHSSIDLRHGVIEHNDGRREDLTGTETKLLELFLSRPEQVLSRDDINRVLHGRDWSPYDRTIDTHIARLRRKIEPADDANRMIRSVRGVGYVFTGQITGEVPPA